jgi:hypothetical protein
VGRGPAAPRFGIWVREALATREPADACSLFALVLIELEVESGEGSLVLGYPALLESAHAPGRAREFGVKFRSGALGHRMA